MELLPLLLQIVIFILLIFGYYKLCTHREIHILGKIAEIVALYGVSAWAILGHLKFIVWVSLIAAIGLIKISTTKKQNERGNKGLVN